MKLLKRKLKDESGQVLVMALVMLVLGGLLVVPTLSFMTTNLNATRQIDTANLELYAADAGVEEVIWHVKYEPGFQLPTSSVETPVTLEQPVINGRTVTATISKQGSDYRITSTATIPATNPDDEHRTTVECYIDMEADLSCFFDDAINGKTKVVIKPGTVVTGNVTYGTENGLTNQGCIDSDGDGTCDNPGGTYDPDLQDNWPTAEYLKNYYLAKVADLISTPFASSQISISGNRESPTPIPRLYRDGSLELKGGGWARLGVDTKVGTADATEANFLRDTCGGFTTSYVGSTVWNTTDNTYALVSSYVSSGKLGISKDIMANGETYTLYNNNCPVYVTGALSVNPTGGCLLDLNGNTFFSGDTIYLGPKTTVRGSGCFIAVGNITFQPNLSNAGDKLVGVDYTTSFTLKKPKNTLLLSKFTAEHTGQVKTFSVLTSGTSSSVKLAIYTDNTGEPDELLFSTTATVGSGLNGSGLNDIDVPEIYDIEVEAGESYWLAAISMVDYVIGYKTCATPCTWESRTKTVLSYSDFAFPSDLTAYGLTEVPGEQYLLAGNALPFLFIMSIEGSSDIKPGGTFYGSVAGDAEVELFPHCTLTLTKVPDTGLDFPGQDTGEDETTGTPATILTYTIK